MTSSSLTLLLKKSIAPRVCIGRQKNIKLANKHICMQCTIYRVINFEIFNIHESFLLH